MPSKQSNGPAGPFLVAHSMVGRYVQNTVVSRDELGFAPDQVDAHLQRLLRLGAIREATPLEIEGDAQARAIAAKLEGMGIDPATAEVASVTTGGTAFGEVPTIPGQV